MSSVRAAKSSKVVVPPYSAALLTTSGPAEYVELPSGIGICHLQCTCGSIPPGMTIFPEVSTHRFACSLGIALGFVIASIYSPFKTTSCMATPCGVTTVPPRRMVSNIISLLHIEHTYNYMTIIKSFATLPLQWSPKLLPSSLTTISDLSIPNVFPAPHPTNLPSRT